MISLKTKRVFVDMSGFMCVHRFVCFFPQRNEGKQEGKGKQEAGLSLLLTWVALWNCFFNPATDITSAAEAATTEKRCVKYLCESCTDSTEPGTGARWSPKRRR